MADLTLSAGLVPVHSQIVIDGTRTLEEIVTELGFGPLQRQGLVVELGGHVILEGNWRRVRPKQTAYLTIRRRPAGGDGGSAFKTVLSVLLVAAAIAVSSGTFALAASPLGLSAGLAAGSFEAQLAAAAILSLGSAGLDALFPTAVTAKNKGGEFGNAGARTNVLKPGDYLPRPFGTLKTWPPQVTKPIRYAVGNDELIEVLYAIAGRTEISDLRISDVPIDEVDGLTYQVVDWNSAAEQQTLLDRYGAVKSLAKKLQWYDIDLSSSNSKLLDQSLPANSAPGWDMVTFPDADEMRIRCQWEEGLAKRNDSTQRVYQPMRVRVRAKGTTSWVNLPEVWWSNKNTNLGYRKDVIIRRSEAGGPIVTPLRDAVRSVAYVFAKVPGQGQSIYLSDGVSSNGAGGGGAAMTPQTSGWLADAWFGSSAINSNFANATSNFTLHDEGVAFYLPESLLPRGPVEVEIIFGAAAASFDFTLYAMVSPLVGGQVTWDMFGYATDSSISYYIGPDGVSGRAGRVVVTELLAIMLAPPTIGISKANAALIAIRGINIQVGDLTCIATSVIYDRATDDWLATDSPAQLSEALARGEATHRAVSGPIDTVAYDAWAAECLAENYRASFEVAGGRWDDVQKALASAGRGGFAAARAWRPYFDHDRSGESPVMSFNPANSRFLGLSRAWPAVTTDALRITYRDRSDSYLERSSLVYAPGVDAASYRSLEDVRYDEIADASLATARGAYDLGLARYRGTRLTLETDYAAEAAQKGDLVMCVWDVLAEIDQSHGVNERAVAQSAYIRSVTRNGSGQITQVTLERPVYLEPSSSDVLAVPNLWNEANILAIGDAYRAQVTVGRDDPANGDEQAGYVIGLDLTIASAGTTATLTVVPASTPRADRIAPGQILTVARATRLARRSIVESITPQDGLFKVVCVPEAPELWS